MSSEPASQARPCRTAWAQFRRSFVCSLGFAAPTDVNCAHPVQESPKVQQTRMDRPSHSSSRVPPGTECAAATRAAYRHALLGAAARADWAAAERLTRAEAWRALGQVIRAACHLLWGYARRDRVVRHRTLIG